MSPSRRPILKNADVAPVDVDGVRTVLVGTVAWVVALGFVLVRYSALDDSGRGWWLGTAVAGVALGGIGLAYCSRRRNRIRQGRSADPTEGLLARRHVS